MGRFVQLWRFIKEFFDFDNGEGAGIGWVDSVASALSFEGTLPTLFVLELR